MGLDTIINSFQAISLSQMDEVKLMNRTDRKYWFHRDMLAEILKDVESDYFLLEIEGERNIQYSTIYYDTIDDAMYMNHHRGKGNRYKIRRRNYVSTQSSFLEVKFKSNKGRTVKVRQSSEFREAVFSEADARFVRENTPYECADLRSVLSTRFRRLMLVSRSMDERCTIDSDLLFTTAEGEAAALGDLVVVEVKSEGRSSSKIVDAMGRHRLKPSGFSKYCVGRSLIEEGLKINNFKPLHREIVRKGGGVRL